MGKFTIYNKRGIVLHESITEYDSDGKQVYADSLEYNGTWMGECFLTLTVKSPYPIDFQIGDYVDYRGERFTLNYDPTVIKKARRGSYGEGFTYDNVKFNARHTELTEIRFLDYVLGDNQLHWTSLPDFPFYAASIDDYCDRLQANTNRWCESNGFSKAEYWLFITPSLERTKQRASSYGLSASDATQRWNNAYGEGTNVSEEKKDVSVTVSNQSIWDALALIKSGFGLNFINRGREVIIGSAGLPTSEIFEYGKGKGLYEIERQADTEQAITTKLYGYGTETNLPIRYYANLGIEIFGYMYSRTDAQNSEVHLNVKWSSSYMTAKADDDGRYAVTISIDGRSYNVKAFGYQVGSQGMLFSFVPSTAGQLNGVTITSTTKIYITSGVRKSQWNGQTEASEQNLPNNMAVNRLMLPGFPKQSLYDWVKANGGTNTNDSTGKATWHGYTAYFSKEKYNPYVLSLNADVLGIRESTKTFDGSDNGEAIYPTIENTGKDAIVAAEVIADNGVFGEGENEPNGFTLTLPNLGFDLKEQCAEGDSPKIVMKSGYCGSREFEILTDSDGNYRVTTNEDGLIEVVCKREHDDLLDLWFPYSYSVSQGGAASANEPYQVRANDKYILTGIPMTDAYIQAAAEKLLEATLEFLSKNDYTRYTYLPKVDEIFMARQHDEATKNNETSIYQSIKEGDLLHFQDADLRIGDSMIFIDTLRIKENGNNGIPTYDVTLRNDKEVGTIQRMQEQINSLTNGGGSGNGGGGGTGYTNAQLAALIQTYGNRSFLSKLKDDTAQGFISFLKGIQIGSQFSSGLLGTGGVFRKEADGTTYLEADKMYVRMKAYFDTVEIRKFMHSSGNRIASDAGFKTVRVVPYGVYQGNYVPLDDEGKYHYTETVDGEEVERTTDVLSTVFYRCYYRASDGDDTVTNDFEIGDMAYCHITNTKLSQRHYWRIVTGKNGSNELTEDGEGWIDLSNRASETFSVTYTDDGQTVTNDIKVKGFDGTDAPVAQDDIVQLGNITDATRRGAIIEYVSGADAPSYKIYQDIGLVDYTDATTIQNPFVLTDKNYLELGYNSQTGRAYMNVFGDTFIGAKDNSTYIRYDADKKLLKIKAALDISSVVTNGNTSIPLSQFASGHEVYGKTLGNLDANDYPVMPYKKGDMWLNAVYPSADITNEAGEVVTKKGSVFNNEILVCKSDSIQKTRTVTVDGEEVQETYYEFNIGDWQLASDYNSFRYLTDALGANTSINGGLILSSMIALRDAAATPNIWSGINGIYNGSATGGGIAAWYGGNNVDYETLSDADKANWNTKRYAKSLFRFDGSGYLAGGNVSWNAAGQVTIKNLTTLIGSNNNNLNLNEISTLTNLIKTQTWAVTGGTYVALYPQTGFSVIQITRNPTTTFTPTDSDVLSFGELKGRFITVDFFNKLFQAYSSATIADANKIAANDTTKTVNNLKILVGAWTEQYLSALGLSPSTGSGGGGAEYLTELGDVNPNMAPSAGQILTYRNGRWTAENAPQSGVNMTAVWSALAANTTEQINVSHLTTALSGYVTTQTLTATLLNYVGIKSLDDGADTAFADVLKNQTGSFFFNGNNLKDGHYDWVGLQIGTSVDKGQLIFEDGTIMVRQNDSPDGDNWTAWAKVLTDKNATVLFTALTTSTVNISATIGGTTKTVQAPTIAFLGRHAEIASNSANPSVMMGGTLFGTAKGFYMTETYGDTNTPASYGNILNIIGTGGGQLLTEWCGNYTTGHLYYRSHRDNASSGAWSPWKTVAFTDDNVASATRLASNDTKSAWGQTYWQNGQPQTISGNMTSVGSITASGRLTITMAYATANTLWATDSGMIRLTASGTNHSLGFAASADGFGIIQSSTIGTGASPLLINPRGGNVGIGLGGDTAPSYKLHVNGYAYTTRLYLASGVYLEYDLGNKGVHLVGAGLYSDSYMSALGVSNSSSSGGGASYLTELLDVNPTMSPSAGQILTYRNGKWTAENAPQSGITSIATLSWTGYSTGSYNGSSAQTITIPDNTNQLTNGAGFITSSALSSYLKHITVNSTTLNNTSGSFAFSGSEAPFAGQDWVGLQIGDSVDKWQLVGADSSLKWRQNDSGGTNTSWGDWRTILDSSNYTSFLSGYATTGQLTNYLPLTGGTMTGNITFSGSAGISYTGAQATYQMIRFMNNTNDGWGHGISIGGGGLTVIGGGESASVMQQQYSAGDERMLIGNDGAVEIISNLQSGWSNGKTFTFNTDGSLTIPATTGTIPLRVSSTTLCTNLNADMLDGYHASAFLNMQAYGGSIISNNTNLDNIVTSGTYVCESGGNASTFSNTPYTGGNFRLWHILNTGTEGSASAQWSAQMILAPNEARMFIRSHSQNAFGSWKEFAFTNSNVASATKLQTARTIWGQSFDGTGNVQGTFYYTNGDATMKIFGAASTESSFGNERVAIQTSFDGQDPETSSYPTSYPTRAALLLQPRGGYVGIGVASPSESLHVSGNIRSNSILMAQSIELSFTTPYIDFHYNKDTADYTSRIIEESNGVLTINEQLRVDKTNGRVGIGTTSPSCKLHVNGYAYTTRLYLASGVYLEYDLGNKGVHLVGAGLYSDSYMSALGVSNSSSSDADGNKAFRHYAFQTRNGSGTASYWHRLGNYVTNGDNSNLVIELFSGDGWNGTGNQNTRAKITIKDGYQSSSSATNSVGVSCERFELGSSTGKIKVKVVATSATAGAVWVLLPWSYKSGSYIIYGSYSSWTHNESTSTDTTSVPSTNQNVTYYYDYTATVSTE